MTPAQNFYNFLKKNQPDWLFTRIETTTERGVPDCHVLINDVLTVGDWSNGKTKTGYYSYRSKSIWFELKVHPDKLNKWQYGWLKRYALKGGKAYVVVKSKGGSIKFHNAKYLEVVVAGMDKVNIISTPDFTVSKTQYKQLTGREL